MRVTGHPPLYLDRRRAGDRAPPRYRPFRHATAWIRTDLPEWGTALEAHLQLIEVDGEWTTVELSGMPVSLVPGGGDAPTAPDPDVDGWAGEVLDALAAIELPVSRVPGTGTVSGWGEGANSFRRKVMAGLRPAAGRALAAEAGRPKRRGWFGRRDRRRSEGPGDPTGAASAISRLVSSIETVSIVPDAAAVRSLEVGWLMIPEGVDPPRTKTVGTGGGGPGRG